MTTETQTAESVSLAGLILAGGMSRRMGTDKAALLLDGQTFLERIVERLAGSVRPLVIVGRAEQVVALEKLLPNFPAIPRPEIIADRYADRGPLEALATGLETLAARGLQLAAVTTCDAPNVDPRLFLWLADRLGSQQQVIMPTDGNHWYGLTAVYRTACAVRIRELLEQGLRRIVDLPRHLPTTSVTLEECRVVDPQLQSFRNANTPEEYEALQSELEQRQGRG
ncbi:MAG: molybdenum cofactor guanylyltransferase [Planctomycetota bacterium]